MSTHGRLIKHRVQRILSRTARQPECQRAPIRMHQEVRVERIRVYHDEVSGLILGWRGCLFALWHGLEDEREKRV
jgi:hypothetical protein